MKQHTSACSTPTFLCLAQATLLVAISVVDSGAASLGCTTPPAGIVSWWQAEGNALDNAGTNNGVFQNPAFGPGEVGLAFSFDGSGNNIKVLASPTLDVGHGGMTIEAWINPADTTGRPIAEWGPGPSSGGYGVHFYANAIAVGVLYANLVGTDGSSHVVQTAAGVLTTNRFQHVALTYDKASGLAVLFVNGVVAVQSTFGNFTPQTSADLYIGYRPSFIPFGPVSFKGLIDELSIYSRALSATEIQAIYNAAQAGKCFGPTGPTIYAQPTNQSASTGETVTFKVLASGTTPLSYQWTFNLTNIDGASGPSLVLTNVQQAQAGTYAVQVTNAYGSIISSNASLTVIAMPPCAPPASGLVSWWPANGNATDIIGGQNGVFTQPAFASGEVGQAFKFDGSGNNIRVPAYPSLDLGKGSGLTVEAWINPANAASANPIVEWAPGGSGGYGVHFYAGGSAQLYADLYSAGDHVIQTGTGVLTNNGFQHVALTYDRASGTARLFLNGLLAKESALGSFTPQTSQDMYIGYRPSFIPFGPYAFNGLIDEVSLYSRALTAAEVQAIFNAGAAGKCVIPIASGIFSQPSDQTVTVGQTATFTIGASGSSPLTYEWFFNGSNIAGATAASLVLTNVQMNQAGNYSVEVTNAYGSAMSSNAVLVVNFPPASVKVVNTSGTAGQMVTVPIVLVANGNENAIGFSLGFSPNLLTVAGVSVGTGANGAALQVNTNQAGTVGIALALPTGTTLAPGTQEVAEVTFVAAVSNTTFSATLSFGDTPTRRELSDAAAHLLAANFTGGQVSLSRSAFEADVAPRPNGDGVVTIVDWVQVGRFVAALDTPSIGSEFQRADCAPRSTLGDGLLTVSDWVQAGRYAAGLDAPTLAGGPSAPAAGQVVEPKARKLGTNPSRILDVQGPLIFQGQTGTAVVNLEAQGDENGIGFSLAFDPAVVTYTSTSLGSDTSSATMVKNINQATNGQLGIILALPNDVSFSPGTRQVVKVNFQAVGAASVNSTLALTDLPVRRDVADTNANSLVATYSNGTISVNPKPSLAITHSTQNISLAWPLWATNYNLQEALGSTLPITTWSNLSISPLVTNSSATVTLPLNGSTKFYRLQH